MKKSLSLETCSLIVQQLFINSSKRKVDQVSMNKLAQRAGSTAAFVQRIREILVKRRLILKEGLTRGQCLTWNPSKAEPNVSMVNSIYLEYSQQILTIEKKSTPDEKIKDGVKAIELLRKYGFTGTISRKIHTGYSIVDEVVVL